MARSRLYRVRGGKKKLISRSHMSPRRNATSLTAGIGNQTRTGSWSLPTPRQQKAWKPKRGRRKLGARRKLTLVEQIFRWIKVPTGRVRRRSVRR